MDMPVIKTLAFEWMGNKRSHDFKEKGNKYYHGERVAALALTLRRHILPDDGTHDDIMTVAAWFHDIMNGADDHAGEGAAKTRGILSPYCSDEELDGICEMIRVHDDRCSAQETLSATAGELSTYIKIHQDADHLDHFGTFDIWMNFIYSVAHEQTINDARDWLVNVRPAEIERYRRELNFALSRKIYDEKMEFLAYFTERFAVEGSGGIWNEAQICEAVT